MTMSDIRNLTPLSDVECELSRIVAVMNGKGGCAKSSFAEAFANRLAAHGYNVLIIDNDPQCNITQKWLLEEADLIRFDDQNMSTFYNGLDRKSFSERQLSLPIQVDSDFLNKYEGTVSLLVGSKNAEYDAETKVKIMGSTACAEAFRRMLKFYSHYYDFILIDTPPSVRGNAINTLTVAAADEIVIPFDGSEALYGINQFMEWANINFISSNQPNAQFIMTKYQTDTKDVLMRLLSVLGVKDPEYSKYKDEHRCSTYTILRKLLPEHVCRVGVPERKVVKNHTYCGLTGKGGRDAKSRLDSLSDEVLRNIRMPRENVFKLWKDERVGEKIERYMRPIENARRNDIASSFYQLKLDRIIETKRKSGLE